MENNEGVVNVNGHAYSDSKLHSENTNFALLVSHHFEEPFNQPNEYATRISAIANQMACGGIIVQSFGDILLGRRSTEKRIKEGFVKPTLKEAVPGDLSLALPYKTMKSIIEMIKVLDMGCGSNYNLFALKDGIVRYERLGRNRKKVSVYEVTEAAE